MHGPDPRRVARIAAKKDMASPKTAAKPTIKWEPQRHTMVPIWEGTPSTRREPGGGNWGGSIWEFNIIQRGEPNETQPGDDYMRGGNKPGTEYWQVEIWPASEGGTRKPWIKPKKKWKTLEAAQDWCLKVLQGRARVPGLRVARIAAKKDMGGTKLRSALYESGDKITSLEDLAGDAPLDDDPKYKNLVKKLSRAHDDLRKHLDANYNWD
jgi:hypothetical protein